MILTWIQSSVLLFVALVAVAMLRRQSAATRHAILSAGLISSLVVPFLGNLLPDLQFEPGRALVQRVQEQATTVFSIPTAPEDRSVVIPSSQATTPRLPVVWIWLGGMTVMGTVLFLGVLRIAWLASRSKPVVSTHWLAALEEMKHLFGLRRGVLLLQTERTVLGAWGILRPKIFLPHDAGEWSVERIRVVLAHELAHIKRFDWPTQILAEVARTVFWFNPLYWIACRWLRLQSEHACDDHVLGAGFGAENYAAHLLDLARAWKRSDRVCTPVLAMSRPPHLERRFIAMLNPSLNHRSITLAGLAAIFAVAMGLTVPVAAMRAPQSPEHLESPVSVVTTVLRPLEPVSASATVEPVPVIPAVPASPAVPTVPTVPARRTGATAALASPQQAEGGLLGTVSDPSGAVVPGVLLTVWRLEFTPAGVVETPVATIVSSDSGAYALRLQEGRYGLKAELPGFTSYRRGGIEVKASQTTRENVILSVGSVAESIQVVAPGQSRPPIPPATGQAPQRIRVGGNVKAANLVSQVRPIYPPSARDSGIEGTVHLQGILGTDGSFITLRVVSSNDLRLANAALEAVRQWRYQPTMLNGEPVEIVIDVDVDFRLSN